MIIGIPKEVMPREKRVAATPDTVTKYVELGFELMVESSAGEGVYCSDDAYQKAGARIISQVEALFDSADLILKVKQPCFNETINKHEADMIRNGATLITFLHPAAPSNHHIIRKLRDKNVTSFTMDGIPRISRAQKMDALTSMSTVTGYKSVLIAANNLPTFIPMIGTAIGTVKPATFLVIGTGVVGLQAIATAKRLGAVVQAMDIREQARNEAASLGAKVSGFEVPEELALGKGGYAKALTAEWLEKEKEALTPLLLQADGIILSALVPGELAPILVTDEMVRSMKPGAAIIDVSIDQGGNCEVTEPGKEVFKHDVYICGMQNIPGRMPIHSTWLYANNMYHYVENLFKKGRDKMDMEDEIVSASLVTYQGKIFFEGALKAMGETG
jgi:NAD(P) transhydrogenase subunit alpha